MIVAMQTHPDDVASASAVDEYFKRGRFRARLRACMFEPFWDELVAWMRGQGYPRGTVYETIRHALRLAEFAEQEGVREPALITDELVERHQAVWADHPRTQRSSRICLRRMMTFLRKLRLVRARQGAAAVPGPPLLREYLRYLAEHRGIGDRQIREHRRQVQPFLEALGVRDECGGAVAHLNASDIFRFVTSRGERLGRAGRKTMCTALRSFLRFLHVRGHLPHDLVSAVPVIPSFKLDRLPRVIAWEDIQKILAAVDRSTAMGRRDYAILLVLATYGLRSCQLCALRLEDVDWRQETMHVRAAKDGHDCLLPLRPAVGEALVDYLRRGRPSATTSAREIFLRVRAPIGPLGGNLTNIIKPYARKAGLTDVPLGAHAWRHACASRMLADGQSLKVIRDTLGHRSIESTFIYTKVDIGMLRKAALEWPETGP